MDKYFPLADNYGPNIFRVEKIDIIMPEEYAKIKLEIEKRIEALK